MDPLRWTLSLALLSLSAACASVPLFPRVPDSPHKIVEQGDEQAVAHRASEPALVPASAVAPSEPTAAIAPSEPVAAASPVRIDLTIEPGAGAKIHVGEDSRVEVEANTSSEVERLRGEGRWVVRRRPTPAPLTAAPAPPSQATAFEPPVAEHAASDVSTDEDEEDDSEGEAEGDDMSGVRVEGGTTYTIDMTDEHLKRLLESTPAKLGSASVGYTNGGRLFNGVQFENGEFWAIRVPRETYGTTETLEYLRTAFRAVGSLGPMEKIRVNDISYEKGGYMRPHVSHQSGRDIDLGFVNAPPGRANLKTFDYEKNWALVRALITLTDVQMILIDRSIIAALERYARSIGEDPEWLDSIFRGGANAIIKHARGHKDHYHIRFYNPHAQELGRRLFPLFPKSQRAPAVVSHKVRPGDTLGKIARKYGSSVAAIKRANNVGNAIRVGRVLRVPTRHTVPIVQPPPLVLPPRRIPTTTPAVYAKMMAPAATASRASVAEP